MERYQPAINAPEFPPGSWLNAIDPLVLEDQAGKLILIDIFDFTCINCIRTLPYLRAWQERYDSYGLQIIGIHTPEFNFAHDPQVVKAGINRLGIHWPVILDNDQSLWTAYANRYWPCLYLIDPAGKIRYRHAGEGEYQSIEATIQALLREVDPERELPDLLPAIRPEDSEGATCTPTTPEIQLGAIHQIDLNQIQTKQYEVPDPLGMDTIYLGGQWRVARDGVTLSSKEGEIALRYKAARVHTVLSSRPDDRESLPSSTEPLYIQILQDDEPLRRSHFGEDILADGDLARFRVDFPRLYNLVDNQAVESHELRLRINQPGLTFYAFSFGSCMTDEGSQASHNKE